MHVLRSIIIILPSFERDLSRNVASPGRSDLKTVKGYHSANLDSTII